jgi:hypothetical protein
LQNSSKLVLNKSIESKKIHISKSKFQNQTESLHLQYLHYGVMFTMVFFYKTSFSCRKGHDEKRFQFSFKICMELFVFANDGDESQVDCEIQFIGFRNNKKML